MTWQQNPYLVPLLLAAGLSLGIALVAWSRRRRVPGARTVAALMLANAVWAVFYALELATPSVARQILFAKLQYLGILTIPGLWLVFTIQYTRSDHLLTRPLRVVLTAVPLAGMLLVLTNDLHALWWIRTGQAVLFMGAQQALILNISHGPLFFVYWFYSNLLLIIGMVLLVRTYAGALPIYRRQIGLVITGAAVPWLGNLLYVLGISPFALLDLTPFAFAITGLIVTWGLLRYRLFDLIPLAHSQVVDRLASSVIVTGEDGVILDLNPAARRLLHSLTTQAAIGPGAHAYLGRRLDGLLADHPNLLSLCAARTETRCDISLSAGQPRDFDVQIVPVAGEHGQPGCQIIVLREITERKKIEAALREARDLAEASSNAKSAFLATMSHELRTPLTVVIGYSEMVQEEATQKGDALTALRLERVVGSARHLLALVNDVLDLSRIEAGRMKLFCTDFALTNLLDETLAMARPLAQANGNILEAELSPDVGSMHSDPTRVRQVLLNLLGNAAKFTEHGRVALRAFRVPGDGCDRMIFEVIDTGVGMTSEQLQNLFQPFTQVDPQPARRNSGAGLGLAITRRLCHILGGEIGVSSVPGQGSTFTVWLPVVAPEACDHLEPGRSV